MTFIVGFFSFDNLQDLDRFHDSFFYVFFRLVFFPNNFLIAIFVSNNKFNTKLYNILKQTKYQQY